MNLIQKRNFQPQIKPVMENELYHLENKHTKGAKLHANIK